ncbi:hypothetical protein CYMTET_48920 [Cymbomonas tetramitiformis]|uniref:PPIase cyclophilin-type domain-containing protein n=1 Tax=Cymbomonas tetramitiformis TaxID=36881 RepID=A0AAE0BT69_9CHLO|nr:hypothetical protein CYMTET_48920 [Cymbomonas tetramitiformis]
MSNVYVTEPPTKGKVVISTTHGDLDVELWAKEAPKACRNFVQLCMEGYYDDTVFHRIIKNFMVQGGDPTGTGKGGDSIYGEHFKDEFHSRLRFSHRGLVAMANENTPNTNGSQFFFTLDACTWLEKKHTIFGKVTGDTIYNLLEIGKMETDETDRPEDPMPKIKNVEVLWNPFEDIEPRHTMKPAVEAEGAKKKKKKGKKDLKLLSFGNEAEEDEQELVELGQAAKIKSSHDLLKNDPKLIQAGTTEEKALLEEEERLLANRKLTLKEKVQNAAERAAADKAAKRGEESGSEEEEEEGGEGEGHWREQHFDERMRKKIMEKRRAMGDDNPLGAGQGDGEEEEKEAEKESKKERKARKEEEKARKEETRVKKEALSAESGDAGWESLLNHFPRLSAYLCRYPTPGLAHMQLAGVVAPPRTYSISPTIRNALQSRPLPRHLRVSL